LRAIAFVLHTEELSAAQRSALQKAVAQLGPDALDWPSAAKRDLESLRGHFSNDPQASAALTRTISFYVAGLSASKAPNVVELHDLPPQLAGLIPNPKRVWDQKQDLTNQLAQTRSSLQ
jgi:hypothetical protein